MTRSRREVRHLRLVPGDGVAQGYCGTAPVKILGHQGIHRAVGTGEGGHYDEWIVGKNAPHHQPQYEPITVKAKEPGTPPFPASMTLVFHGLRGSRTHTNGSVDWTVSGDSCDMEFTFTAK